MNLYLYFVGKNYWLTIACSMKLLVSIMSLWIPSKLSLWRSFLLSTLTVVYSHFTQYIYIYIYKRLKPRKLGHWNLVLITSTVELNFQLNCWVELSKLNFNFDNIRTYFLQVLRDCWQITFFTLNGFCLLSKKPTSCS